MKIFKNNAFHSVFYNILDETEVITMEANLLSLPFSISSACFYFLFSGGGEAQSVSFISINFSLFYRMDKSEFSESDESVSWLL